MEMCSKTTGVKINLAPEMSLQDVRTQLDNGTSVMRSAHVGNARSYNLAVAQLGIPMLLVDHTSVSQLPDQIGDKNYLPGSVVTRETIEPLALNRLGGLALQTEASCHTNSQKRYIDELHKASLQAAFPETMIQTNTDYVRKHESVAADIITVALKTRPDLFTRVVEGDGTVRQTSRAARLVPTLGILQLNDYPRTEAGVLIPNEVDIVINFAIEALESGRDRQIHLSGPDMHHYIKDSATQTTLDELYAAARSQTSLGNRLPDVLEVSLVPSSSACFVTTAGRSGILQRVFDTLKARDKHTDYKQAFFATDAAKDDQSRHRFIERARQQNHELVQELQAAVAAATEILVGPKQAPFLSQYDVLLEGGVAMPPENLEYPMTKLAALGKQLRKVRDKL